MNYSELTFNALKAEAKKLGINTQNMKKEAIIAACEETTMTVIPFGEGKGRPVDPNSKRQVSIREREARKAAGIVGKKGRPVVEGSKNQLKTLERAAKIAAGEIVKRGRPTNLDSMRQQRLSAIQAKKEAGAKLWTGRPINPNSARQQKLARIQAMKAEGTFKLGRPVAVKVDTVA